MNAVPKPESMPCKRPYSLGKRLEQSDHKRVAILAAARRQLEQEGFLRLTMDSLAAEAAVTRQTIHNLFGTKTGVLEALFDQIAFDGGMSRMPEVMQQRDPEAILAGFVRVFTDFWGSSTLLIRRVHGIAAIDPEFGKAVEARNRRRLMAATRVVAVIDRRTSLSASSSAESSAQDKVALLYALTSFEFFSSLTEASKDGANCWRCNPVTGSLRHG